MSKKSTVDPKKWWRAFLAFERKNWKAGFVAIQIFLCFFFLLIIAGCFFVWRLSTAPLDVGFAKGYVQAALRTHDRSVTMDQLVLHWPDLRGPLLLGLRDVRVMDSSRKVIASMDEAALGLSKTNLLIGRIAPVALVMRSPSLRLIRTEDGEFNIGFGNDIAAVEGQSEIAHQILDYLSDPAIIQEAAAPLATLRAVQIERARVMIEDHVIGVSWFLPRFDIALENRRRGLSAELYIEFPGTRYTESNVRARLVYDQRSGQTQMQAAFNNFDTRMVAGKIPELDILREQDIVFNASMSALFDESFRPVEAKAEITSPNGSLMIADLSADPVPYQDMSFTAVYDGAAKTLAMSDTRMTINDVALRAEALIEHSATAISGPVSLYIDELAHSDLVSVWPAALQGENIEEWLIDKMSNGTFRNLSAVLNFQATKDEDGWQYDAEDILAKFAFEDMTVDYRAPMIPATNIFGHGSYDNRQDKLKIMIDRAKVADINVTKGDLEFVNINVDGAGIADIHLYLKGPVRDALDYVSREPISLDHGFPIDQVRGTADLTVNVVLPTIDDLPIEAVKVNVTGTLSDVHLPGVVGSLDLGGGPYSLKMRENAIEASGSGLLSGRAVKAEYRTFLDSEGQKFKAQVVAETTADADMRAALGMDLSKFLEGSVPVHVTYTEFRDGTASVDVKGDISPARLFVEPFDYEKAPGTKGEFTLKAALRNEALQQITELKASAPAFALNNATLGFRGAGDTLELAKGNAPSFVVGETVGKLDFEINTAGKLKIQLDGQVLDLRPFMTHDDKQDKDYDDMPLELFVSADRMITNDGQSVQYGKIYADIDAQGRFNQLEMDATAGSGDIYLRYKPDAEGVRTFRFEADDAGATLKAFGVYSEIVGGKMNIYAEPIDGIYDRNLVGKAEITDFRAVNTPVLARLLSALSLTSIGQALGNEGLSFTKLEADFDWVYRPHGSVLVLKNGRTSGNSLGLTFDGTFDHGAGQVNVDGTIIPLSGVNSVIGSIPLVGDILTGKTGGIFAATYSIKGDGKDPQVFVNPLSVLAPGIFRTILFE